MNTRMLLTAVLRNRRSQWTLLPKAEAADPDNVEEDADTTALSPAAAETQAKRSAEPAVRSG